MSNDTALLADQSASASIATDFSLVPQATLTTELPKKLSSYAIATAGNFTDNGSSNFAGDLSNPLDDARIYSNAVMTLNGVSTFSTLGESTLLGPEGVLQNGSVKVGRSQTAFPIEIPAYAEPTISKFDLTIDGRNLALNRGADVAQVFGSSSIVHLTGGGLNLPGDTVLRNLTIVVDQGDVNFNGDGHLLENVRLIVKNGAANLANLQAVNAEIYADGIRMNQGARFKGRNLLASEGGEVVFNGTTDTVNTTDFVKVVAQGNIFLNAATDVRGEFWSGKDLFANQRSRLVGRIRAKGDVTFNAPMTVVSDGLEYQPLIGIIDTGFNGSNPDIDYSRIILGRDRIDGDDNPFITPGQGDEHGTHILGLIGATQNNGIGIDGINDQSPIWLGRAIGTGSWADSLIEFVNQAKQSGQPHAIVNLSLDLIQVGADGKTTTRYELTPQEWQALEYARQNGVLIVVASGNDGGVMSALGQASQMFDNLVTVGAADQLKRSAYSNYGEGLGILAPGGTVEFPVLSTVDTGLGTLAGTSVATGITTGAISRIWAANPNLNYRQIIEIVKTSAIDLNSPGWDAETGAGLLNVEAAIELAKTTTAQPYAPEPIAIPLTWNGEGDVLPLERAANFTGSPGDQTAVIINKGLNIRSGASRTFPKVGKLNPNERVEFDQEVEGELVVDPNGQGQSSKWYRLVDGRGWVSALYVGNIQQIPTEQPPPPKSSVPEPFYPVWTRLRSTLKEPTSGVLQSSGAVTYMLFEGGSIVNSSLGTFPLQGVIRQEYLRTGGLTGWLGVPKSGEISQGNGIINQYFANGYITWNGKKAIAYRSKPQASPVDSTAPSSKPSKGITTVRTGAPSAPSLGDVVNTAKTAWDVIKDGKPVAAVTSDFANALPKDTDWTNLSGWSTQRKEMALSFEVVNLLGFTTIRMKIVAGWFSNGSLNGQGKFINNATLVSDVYAAWGWNINMTASIKNPFNIGKSSDPKDVIAALPVNAVINDSTILQNRFHNIEGLITGDGEGSYLKFV